MLLYLVRHGETDWNKNRRLQGRTDIPLNENGRSAAREAQQLLREVPIDCAFTSPLLRAKETAQIILADRPVPLYTDERIREISFGVQEGCEGRDESLRPIGIFAEFFEHPDSYVPPEDGEDVRTLCSRTRAFLEDITTRSELQDKSVLIATHGAALQSMLLWIRGLPYADFWKSGLKRNCSITKAEAENGRVRILEEGAQQY